jgi:hypothetical protein
MDSIFPGVTEKEYVNVVIQGTGRALQSRVQYGEEISARERNPIDDHVRLRGTDRANKGPCDSFLLETLEIVSASSDELNL